MAEVCVFGGGAIGGFLAARLALAGAGVTIVARGAHRAAMLSGGLVLESGGTRAVCHPTIADDPAALGPQDILFLTVKAHSLLPALPTLRRLIGPRTIIVAGVNGLPWWYFHSAGGAFDGRRIEAVDPGGAVSAGLPPEQTLGCVLYAAADVPSPGVVRHGGGERFTLGEPGGGESERARRIAGVLERAGLQAPVAGRIRDEIWVKLWGNMAFNPISALTTAGMDGITGDAGVRGVARAMMLEGRAVAEALGVTFTTDIDMRLARAAGIGAHRTSMLQDLDRGRPLEVEAVLGAVVEVAAWVGVPVPLSAAMLALVRQRDAMQRG